MSPPTASDRTLVRVILFVLAVLVLAPLLTMGFAMPMMSSMGWGWHDAGLGGVAPWWGLGMGVLWLALLVALGYVGYRWVVDDRTTRRVDPALDELRLAYARGDLTDEEFEARRAVLEDDSEA